MYNRFPHYERFPMDDEIKRLVQKANRPDRLYPIRSNKYYGFWTGHLPDGRQALVDFCGSWLMEVLLFSHEGNYLGREARKLDPMLPPDDSDIFNDQQLHAYLSAEFGFTPALIRIKRFYEPEASLSIVS